MAQKKNILVIAEQYACEMHGKTGQLFDKYPYEYHLSGVVDVGKRFIHLIPEKDRDNVLAGCWGHDLIEDAGVTYNNVLKMLNLEIAEYVYALTNEKGRNRAERANSKYYQGIREYKHASFIKLCDRIFNLEYSKNAGSGMYKKYKQEHENFRYQLHDFRFEPIWEHIETLIK